MAPVPFFFYGTYIRFAGILLRSCLSFVSRVYPFGSGVGFTYGGDLDYPIPSPHWAVFSTTFYCTVLTRPASCLHLPVRHITSRAVLAHVNCH
jgi:hypothetical protein